MRKLLIVVAVALLNGCAVYDAMVMTGYDPNEYRIITEVRVEAIHYKSQCGTATAQANAQAMAYKTDLFEKYSEQIPHNHDGYGASKSLNEIAQGLVDRYTKGPVPDVFCKLKYGSIENSAQVIQHVIGNRPR
jgi:hypothetical protein